MGHVSKGLLAGFVATVALSLLMVMKNALGLMPELNIIAMLTNMANNWVGLPATPVVGWLIHFMVGTIFMGSSLRLFIPSCQATRNQCKAWCWASSAG